MLSSNERTVTELRRDRSQISVKLGPYSSLLSVLLALAYFTYRIYGLRNVDPGKGLSPSALSSWIYLFAELGIFLSNLFNNLFRIVAIGGSSPAPCLRYLGDTGPRIDIFIVCCGEEFDTVLNTVYVSQILYKSIPRRRNLES